MSINEFDIIPLYCVGLPGYTWQCGLKYTGINLQTLQDKDLILLLEYNICGGISSIIGDRYVKSDDNKKHYMQMLIICKVTQCLNQYLMMKLNLIRMLNEKIC